MLLAVVRSGSTLVESLSAEGHDVVALEKDAHVLEQITNMYDVMASGGNGADCEILEEAAVDKAELVVAATGSDEMNMLCCFLPAKWAPSTPSPECVTRSTTTVPLALCASS